jgi:hypothetical protein
MRIANSPFGVALALSTIFFRERSRSFALRPAAVFDSALRAASRMRPAQMFAAPDRRTRLRLRADRIAKKRRRAECAFTPLNVNSAQAERALNY